MRLRLFLVRLMRPHISPDEAHRIAFGFSEPDDPYFATRLREGLGERGRTPCRSRTEREQRTGHAAEEVGFWTCRGEDEAHAACGFDDTGGDFQEPKTQRRELGSGQFPGFGNGVAHGENQPISKVVQNEADLIGGAERQLVRSEASCVLCSLIRFSPWPRAHCRLS